MYWFSFTYQTDSHCQALRGGDAIMDLDGMNWEGSPEMYEIWIIYIYI